MLAAAAGFALIGVAAAVLAWRWPTVPAWTRPLIVRTPLGAATQQDR
jgi:hypothetical protein